jgi:hypothetical protein
MANYARLICTIIGVFLPLTSQARLGETPEECSARYGAAVATVPGGDDNVQGTSTIIYEKGGMKIVTLVYEGRVVFISYEKPGTGETEQSQDISEGEIGFLLDANSQGKTWIPALTPPNAWRLEDGTASAAYHNHSRKFIVSSTQYMSLSQRAQSAQDQQHLKGF